MPGLMFEQRGDQRHAHRHAVRRLLEVDGPRVVVEVVAQFVDARQGMHDAALPVAAVLEKLAY